MGWTAKWWGTERPAQHSAVILYGKTWDVWRVRGPYTQKTAKKEREAFFAITDRVPVPQRWTSQCERLKTGGGGSDKPQKGRTPQTCFVLSGSVIIHTFSVLD